MKLHSLRVLAFATLAAVPLVAAKAELISYFSDTVKTTSATELGRPSRNGQPQTWTGVEAYPGVLSTTTGTTYYYNVYNFSSSLFQGAPSGAPYVDISFTDELASGLLFISAYVNSYNPSSRGTNWLGDLGFLSNSYGSNSLDFNVVLPAYSNLLLVVTTTGGGTSGTGLPFDVAVNAYADTMYNDPLPTPEPSTWLMVGSGVLAGAGAIRRKVLRVA